MPLPGQLKQAEIVREDEQQSAVLLVSCGDIPLRVNCGPAADGTFALWYVGNASFSGAKPDPWDRRE